MKISLRAKDGVPKTLVKQKLPLHSLHFPQNTLLLTESRGESGDLYSIFRLRALRYLEPDPVTRPKSSDLVFTISKFNKNTQTYQVSVLRICTIMLRICTRWNYSGHCVAIVHNVDVMTMYSVSFKMVTCRHPRPKIANMFCSHYSH